jgi:hypothetical protein
MLSPQVREFNVAAPFWTGDTPNRQLLIVIAGPVLKRRYVAKALVVGL